MRSLGLSLHSPTTNTENSFTKSCQDSQKRGTRHQLINEIVIEAGCEIWYLPTYSPDLNKIERWWFVLKNWMKQRWDEFEEFRDCVDAAFKKCPNVYS